MADPNHLDMNHWYEAYLMADKIDDEHWKTILLAISQHIGVLRAWKLVITIENSTVRYFVGTNKDIGLLSNNLESIVLRPIDSESIEIPKSTSRICKICKRW
jgi:hypothetical protein